MATMWETLLEKAAAVGDSLEDPTAVVLEFMEDEDGRRELADTPSFLEGRETCKRFFNHYTHGGYGAAQVPPSWVYGEQYVYVVAVYDGATWWEAIPRHPEVAMVVRAYPDWVGGQ